MRATDIDIHEALVRTALAQHYPVPVLRVDDGVLRVPAGRAIDHAREALVRSGIDEKDAAQIVQPIMHDALPWWAVPSEGMTIWRAHGVMGHDAEIVTQLLVGDPPFQIIARHDEWQLVRTLDGATGWLQQSDIEGQLIEDVPAWPGDTSSISPRSLVACALELAGTRYVWGGTTTDGIDCSGLVQRAAWSAARVWLPRHSTALLRVGTRVARSRITEGDVLVLKRRPSAPPPDDGMPTAQSGPSGTAMHVAIAITADELIHASRDAWSVVTEPRTSVEARYQVLSVRRFAGSTD